METLIAIFGEGRNLTALQMSCRGIVVFFIALILIRISGRRSFGVRTPFDNIIVILLGAILSRAVVGASEFVPVVICCFVLVLLHRLFGWLVSHYKLFSKWVEGNKIILYEGGKFHKANMRRGLLAEEDVLEGVRRAALTDDLKKIDKVYMERNGEISAIRKS